MKKNFTPRWPQPNYNVKRLHNTPIFERWLTTIAQRKEVSNERKTRSTRLTWVEIMSFKIRRFSTDKNAEFGIISSRISRGYKQKGSVSEIAKLKRKGWKETVFDYFSNWEVAPEAATLDIVLLWGLTKYQES